MAEHPTPYRDIHSNLSSSFSSAQPVDVGMESIRYHVQKGIPNALDTLLFLHGSLETETSSSGAAGAIELFPTLAETKYMAAEGNSQAYRHAESILSALSDHAYFPMSHIRVYRSGGSINEFSLAFGTPQAKGLTYELQGALAMPGEDADGLEDDTFYWLEHSENGPVAAPLALDKEAAFAIVNAACLQHNQDDAPESLTDKLLYLLEKSPLRSIRRMGEYAVNGGEKFIRANRSELATRKMGRGACKLTSYDVLIQQTIPIDLDGVSIISALSQRYDISGRPRNNASYDMIVNDPHQTIDRDARTRLFEERFMLYRSQPELFFDEIASSLEQASSL